MLFLKKMTRTELRWWVWDHMGVPIPWWKPTWLARWQAVRQLKRSTTPPSFR